MVAEAVIWDMDGVIADTGPFHCKSWQHVFRKRGVNYTEEDFRHIFGQRNDTIIRKALGEQVTQGEIDIVAAEKEEFFRRAVGRRIKPFPGVIELLKSLKEHGFKIALASSAPLENIRLILQGLGIEDYFQAIVYGREVNEGKPSPQCFLLAAQKLCVEPQNCIVVEDAVAGVAAAKRAGMRCVAVTNTHPAKSLLDADMVVSTLSSVKVEDLQSFLWAKS